MSATRQRSESKEDTHIAFIGLGNMGAPMATNLLKQGYHVTVFDLSEAALARLKDAGAQVAASPEQAAKNAQVVITMLPAGQHVKSVYLGDAEGKGSTTGLFAALPKGTLVIDSSTIAAKDARVLSQAAQDHGLEFIDAPVSGGTAGAAAATLTFIVGGEARSVERARSILAAMGKNIFHAGDAGAGQVAKICNNMLLGILMSGTAEALNLGIKNGLDAAVLSDIMLKSSGRNWTLEVYNPYPQVMEGVPSSREYSGGFMTAHMNKDLRLAMQTAADTGVEVPMGERATQLYEAHMQECDTLDFSSIMAYFDPSILDSSSG